jgi:PAS domain S-box-containing protein
VIEPGRDRVTQTTRTILHVRNPGTPAIEATESTHSFESLGALDANADVEIGRDRSGQAPFEVVSANDEATARRALDRAGPSIAAVVCDGDPDEPRLETLAALTDDRSLLPVLYRTPTADGDLASAASARGADGYCTHDDDLGARLDDLLNRHDSRPRTDSRECEGTDSDASEGVDSDASEGVDSDASEGVDSDASEGVDSDASKGPDSRDGEPTDDGDLTETRAELATENERFQNLFQSLPDPVVENEFVDGEPVVERVNPAFERVFGYDAADVVGEPLNDFIVPEGRERDARELDSNYRKASDDDEYVVSREVVRSTATGDRHFLFRGVTYVDDDSYRGYAIYTDMTTQRERERRLQVLQTVLRHNIRTEMTLVSGYADELAAESDQPVLAANIREAVQEVLDLGDAAREFERVLSETTEFQRIDVAAVVRDAVDELAGDYPDRPVDVDVTSTIVIADHRLQTVIEQLVENAFEHGDGTVSITISSSTETIEVHIRDDGDGVPAFERELVTGDRDITQLEHGSGLGLWVATWLLDRFHGNLRFEATGDAGGNDTVVVLPRPNESSISTQIDTPE